MSRPPFQVDRAEDSPGLLLWQVGSVWQRRIRDALTPYETPHAHFVILAILLWFELQGRVMSQVDIAEVSKMDKMTISKALQKMGATGLILRQPHPSDTRAKAVSLTAKGRALGRQLVPIVEAVDAHFFGRVAEGERTMLCKILGQLAHDL